MGRIRHADRTAGAVIGDRTLVHRRVTRTNAAHHQFFRNLLEWRLSAFTATRRKYTLFASITGGEFWSGTRTSYNGGLWVRPKPGMTLGARYGRNNISLPGGDFSTNLMRLEGGWQLSPWASFAGNVQYDDDSELVGLFARFHWIIRPGNDLFLVYTHNWQNRGDRLYDFDYSTLSRGATNQAELHVSVLR